MAEYPQNRSAAGRAAGPDGIGCASSLLILLLVLFVMSSMLSGTSTPTINMSPTVQEAQALVNATATTVEQLEQATATASSTPSATATPIATATAMATTTATATATSEPVVEQPTLPPTFTAVPEDTPTATATLPPPPLPTPTDAYSWTLKVPILMYHYISTPPEDSDKYRIDLSVEPDAFRAQMAYLAANGYSTIDLYDLSLAIANKQELPPKPVIITIDDGYLDNYEHAFPILREFGFKATFFVITEFIDRNYAPYMNWAMIEEMAAAGMRIEPHTKTHPDLTGQERDYLIWQILGSQQTVAAHIGYTPRYLAYPAGRYDEATVQILRELDFWGAVTTAGGKWHGFNDRYEWTRLRVRHSTTLQEFIDLIDPGDTVGGKSVGG